MEIHFQSLLHFLKSSKQAGPTNFVPAALIVIMHAVCIVSIVKTVVLGAVEVLPLARGCLLLHELTCKWANLKGAWSSRTVVIDFRKMLVVGFPGYQWKKVGSRVLPISADCLKMGLLSSEIDCPFYGIVLSVKINFLLIAVYCYQMGVLSNKWVLFVYWCFSRYIWSILLPIAN